MRRHPPARLALAVSLALASPAFAQAPAAEPPKESAPKPADKPAAKPGAKPAEPAKVESISVEGRRTTTTDRRDSTASKIIVGRDEIEQYGDTNLGDVLRRLPGVTQSGRPGRRGPIAFRGMGGGFTQILVNGERIPPGFSIEDIAPEQVERIEILRAPTAETGTRAIAGTINIVLREALRKRSNDWKGGVQVENGRAAGNLSYSRNDAMSETGTYNFTLSLNHRDTLTESESLTRYDERLTGLTTHQQRIVSENESKGDHLFMTTRFQWRLGPGEQLSFQPFVVANRNVSQGRGNLEQLVGAAPYATSESRSESRFEVARFMTMLNRRLTPETSWEIRGGAGRFQFDLDARTRQFDAAGAQTLLQTTDNSVVDSSFNTATKLTHRLLEVHALSAGLEWEQFRRTEKPVTVTNGVPQLGGFGENVFVKTRRAAAWLQEEWDPNPNWSASAGVRWEEIRTRSFDETSPLENTSRVVNPLAHVVWRFDAPKRDQVRASLTQSYRSPTTQNLVARPRLNTQDPVPGGNQPTSADSAGNPNLKPEIANGLELAYEYYLTQNGVVSANVFTRRLKDVIRNVTALETVSWAPVPRWVSRPQNFGRGRTSGIEIDGKFVLTELVKDAPAVNLRANVSVFRSSVEGIPGPDNRLASQPDLTANLGADYRFKGSPWSVGGNLNWTPGYSTQLTEQQRTAAGRKLAFDTYALYHFENGGRLRFTLAGVVPRDEPGFTQYVLDDEIQSVNSRTRGHVVAGIRYEIRL